MKKLLAVSGGVDSVVLLHMLKDDDVTVAHFNHGTRTSADDDELFVKNLAKKYQKPFFSKKIKLGENVSELDARNARYDFLKSLAKKENAVIYTAHHLDDLAESIAINLARGTGWRGLAVFSDTDIKRPLVERHFAKSDILRYAAEHNLIWRYDPTNSSEKYLRNRLREKLKFANIDFEKLTKLYISQTAIKSDIIQAIQEILPEDSVYKREWFKTLEEPIAIEILKIALEKNGASATRPQIAGFLNAIKTYAPEKTFNLPNDNLIKLHKNFFTL